MLLRFIYISLLTTIGSLYLFAFFWYVEEEIRDFFRYKK